MCRADNLLFLNRRQYLGCQGQLGILYALVRDLMGNFHVDQLKIFSGLFHVAQLAGRRFRRWFVPSLPSCTHCVLVHNVLIPD